MLSVFGSFGTPARRSPLHFDTAPDHADTTRGDLGATVREAIRKDCFSCSSYPAHGVDPCPAIVSSHCDWILAEQTSSYLPL